MTRTTRHVLISVLIAGLLLGGIGLARGRGGTGGPAGARPEFAGPVAVRGGPAAQGGLALPTLAGLPIGAAVEVAFHDADPASGAEPVTTLAITVGVDSEAAFAGAFAEARAAAAEWEVAYLVVATGEIRRTIDLPEDDAAEFPRRATAVMALRHLPAGWGDGDTVTVELYDADPADGGNLLETLAFAYGVDSAIGFRAAVEQALEGAAVAVVTTSPRSLTVDLEAVPERATGIVGRMGVAADRMGRMVDRLGDAVDRWDGAPMAPGKRGRR
jgi:hypothetical protein